MSVAALLAAALLLPAASDVAHVDAGLRVDGRLLSVDVRDVDADGTVDLTVAVFDRALARRELRVFRMGPSGRDPEPHLVVPVKSDVVAWCWAEVRPEAGLELVFVTRSGAWAYSPAGEGYRDILRLVSADMLYDLPDPRELPLWEYVLRGEGADRLLLPGPDDFAVWGPGGEDGAYVREADFEARAARLSRQDERRRNRDGIRVTPGGVQLAGQDERLSNEDGPRVAEPSLVSADLDLRSPALVDVDGDGRLDMLRISKDGFDVHLADADGVPAEPTRTETWPEVLDGLTGDIDHYLHDLDGDGDIDLLTRVREEDGGGLQPNREFNFFVLLNERGRLLPEKPAQVHRFEGANVRPDVADVDADGLPDLVFSKLVAPGILALTSPDGLELRRSVLVFRGLGRGRFSRQPDVEKEDVYGEATLAAAIVRRRLRTDLDGDGLADLVDIDLNGETLVYRMRVESSFFGGDSWQIDETPWRRFSTRGAMRGTEVEDVNGDGLGDIMSLRKDRLVLLLSHRTGGRR